MTLDIIGQRFGRLVVKSSVKGTYHVVCKCDCGNTKTTYKYSLTSGYTRSCGCLLSETHKTHGMSRSPEYNTWGSMKRRCYKKDELWYPYYGGKGITVCKRWRDSFENFYADMGSRPDGTSLDRIDGSKNYTPENCRWATRLEQAQNSSKNRNITYEGRTMCAAAWSRETGVPYKRLIRRLRDGWSPERALNPQVYPGQ